MEPLVHILQLSDLVGEIVFELEKQIIYNKKNYRQWQENSRKWKQSTAFKYYIEFSSFKLVSSLAANGLADLMKSLSNLW